MTARVEAKGINIEDADADAEVRRWLNGAESPLDWAGPGVTPDEWFFVTTLYGTMNLDGQRNHIRKFFPYFVSQTNRDIRNFTSVILADWRLRQPWMKTRLCRMADVLVQAGPETLSIDARPSDAIAVALRAKAPIFVNEQLLQEPPRESAADEEGDEPPEEPTGEPSEEEKAEQLRRFLEKLNPEDFGKFQI